MRVRCRPDAAEAWRRQHEQSAHRDDGLETTSLSGMEVKPLYSSDDLDGIEEDFPGTEKAVI